MNKWILWIPVISLLTGCILSSAGTAPAALPGIHASQTLSSHSLAPDNQILPGSKGDRTGILPGSKGDRLESLEVQLRLPDIGFQINALQTFKVQAQGPEIKVSVDAQPVEASFISARKEGSDVVCYYQLKDVPISQNNNQELIFTSANGVVQTAGLVQPLQKDQQRIALPFDLHTLAVWLVAGEFQQRQNKSVQELSPDALQALDNLSYIQELTDSLKSLYRTSEGKTDPVQSAAIRSQVVVSAQKYQESAQSKQNATSDSSSSNNNNSPQNTPSQSSGQSGNPSSQSSGQSGNNGDGSSNGGKSSNGNRYGHSK